MIIVMFHTPVEPGKEREFEHGFAHRARAVDQMPGFIGMEILRHREKGEYIVVTRWRSAEDYQAWLHSPAFDHAHGGQSYDPQQSRPQEDVYEVVEV